ncbi:hypothetical protein [Aurantiacibacter rhizosphaerae]|uniref:Uncharacterized protein n=1 Tax=Aurantiacibacter rhizosphaerae TaxID=2691582 RepID=A0A844XDB4_9SPHN|nr:hypothetical protein [Aurantiacibacter rhizosphaerae]MWV27598.1 hypothetical protein [Aurantiacibacter rhizosphaerae]
MKAPLLALAAMLGLGAMPTMVQSQDAPDAQADRVEQFSQLPFWPGYWVAEEQAGTTVGGIAPSVLAAREKGEAVANFMNLRGGAAKWNAEGQRRLEAAQAINAGRKAAGWGFPMMMNAATPLQFVITPEHVLIVNAYSEVRHVYTDRDMPDEFDLWPTVMGTSVGHWEGDTLVVETTMVRSPIEYFHGAPPFSDDAHYEERIRLEGDRLVSDVTVTDPTTLEEPFVTQVSWIRDEGFDRMIMVDWDNDRTGVDENGVNTIEAEVVE